MGRNLGCQNRTPGSQAAKRGTQMHNVYPTHNVRKVKCDFPMEQSLRALSMKRGESADKFQVKGQV